MSSNIYDVVVVGAGHNTLTTAAYLARCGMGVLVLEKKSGVGGGAVSEALTLPGFSHDSHATGLMHLTNHPIILSDELNLLSKYGLELVGQPVSFVTVFDDGDAIACYRDLDRTCAEFAKFSQKDADQYRSMAKFMETFMPLIGMAMAKPPASFGKFVGLLENIPMGGDLVLAMMKSAYEVVLENFEHPKIQMHFLKWVSETGCGPEDKTTGLNLFFLIGASHSHPGAAVVGGTQRLSDAMVRCIEDNGGEVRTNSGVKRIINRGGEAKTVELEDGSVITAKKAVVAGIHPHALGDMVTDLDEGLVRRARSTTLSSYSNIVLHFALKEKVKWRPGAEIANDALAINLLEYQGMDAFRQTYDGMKYGMTPKLFMGCVAVHSNYDSQRAPAGQHTLYCNVFAPYALADGGAQKWDEVKETHADWLTERLHRFCPNIDTDNVLARAVHSPLDVARHSPSFVRGDFMGLGMFVYQSLGLRPTPELSQYRVPGADGLYLAGPFMHPGGGITGGGRAVAIRIMEDLGISYTKVIRS